jgi:hypothetical protein
MHVADGAQSPMLTLCDIGRQVSVCRGGLSARYWYLLRRSVTGYLWYSTCIPVICHVPMHIKFPLPLRQAACMVTASSCCTALAWEESAIAAISDCQAACRSASILYGEHLDICRQRVAPDPFFPIRLYGTGVMERLPLRRRAARARLLATSSNRRRRRTLAS